MRCANIEFYLEDTSREMARSFKRKRFIDVFVRKYQRGKFFEITFLL